MDACTLPSFEEITFLFGDDTAACCKVSNLLLCPHF